MPEFCQPLGVVLRILSSVVWQVLYLYDAYLGAKADSTVERYSRAFEKFRPWAAGYREISVLPTSFLHVATYLEFLVQSNSPYSALEAAVYGIRWAHDLFGLPNPCDSNLVKGILESAKRSLSRPIVKKEPVTPDMVLGICRKFASANANLSDLRTAAICVTAFAGFLRLMNWRIYAVVMLSFVKTTTLNYLLLRVRPIFTEMEMLFCWLGILLARIIC